MILFLFGSSTTPSSESQMQSSTTFSGVLLLVGYMTCDAFTSNWQNKLFQSYQVTSIQAMFGINLFSTCLTLVSLLLEERLMVSLVFMFQYTHFALDCIVLSFCSAVGQLFIFHTISVFGKYFMVCMLHSWCMIHLSNQQDQWFSSSLWPWGKPLQFCCLVWSMGTTLALLAFWVFWWYSWPSHLTYTYTSTKMKSDTKK